MTVQVGQYTVNSAIFANPDNTSAVIMTDQAGGVLISELDRPELWADLMNSGLSISPLPEKTAIQKLYDLDLIVSRYVEDRYTDGKLPNLPQEMVDAINEKVLLRQQLT